MKRIILFLMILTTYSGYEIRGQVSPGDSLEHYMDLAAKNNPLVMQKFSEYNAARAKIPQAGSLADPELTAGFFLQPMELPEGRQVAEIQLMQMFPWFGTLSAAKDEMSQMAKARFEAFRTVQIDLFFEVQTTLYELYSIRKQKNIAEKNLHLLQVIERMTGVEYSTSSGSLSDLYRVQIETGELMEYMASLETREQALIAKFNSFLDRPPDFPVHVMDSLVYDSLAIRIPVANDSIFKNNPMLEMIRYEENAYAARKKMSGRMGYPMVGIGVEYSLMNKSEMSSSSMNGKDMIMPMVKLTLPVYRSKYNAQQTEAGLLKETSRLNYQSTVNSLQTDFYQTLQQYRDAGRRIRLYARQSELAGKSLTLMITSYSSSGGNLTDILRIRQQTLDYENKHLEAVTDYFTAVARLKKILASYKK